MDELERQLETELLHHLDASDGSHDLHHARRVKHHAAQIAEREGAGDMRLLTAAAYLHDLVNIPKDSPQRSQASRLSAEAAAPILVRLGFGEEETAAVQHIISAHSFSAEIAPQTLEAKILQDADRLEAVGALGIARTFYIGGKLRSQLFDGDDPFAQHRGTDDARFAVDHFKAKLLGLAATMQTAAGRELARQRSDFMVRFLVELGSEIGVPYPASG